MNKTVEEIQQRREDLSDFVFHFTKGANAQETLIQILSDGVIKDMCNKGYICFTETPILLTHDMFDIFAEYANPLYAPYGIGIRRDKMYELGGRPVIYGTEDDQKKIDQSLMWRFVMMKPGVYDFSWLREWRLPKGEYKITDDDIVIVSTIEEEQSILMSINDIDIEAEPADGGAELFYYGNFSRAHKGISIERIRNMHLDTKDKLRKDIEGQSATETFFLGSEWK